MRALPCASLDDARRLSVAPMMDWTDRHCRRFLRILSPRALLYTEMVVAEAVLRGRTERVLAFDPAERPLALQLGGSEPRTLALAAKIGEDWGYDEINLNVGCPSDRVQNGAFGACLMARADRVAECVDAMRAQVSVPVTVKCRIGIDDQDSEQFLFDFVDAVARAGCDTFVVHARKAILSGLTPKQNREIPPLRYPTVWGLKARRPELTIVINGGIRAEADAEQHWQQVDGVMIGREAYHNPYFLARLERRLWPSSGPLPEPSEVVALLRPYVEAHLQNGGRLHAVTRHLLGLYAHRPGARQFRRVLSERANAVGACFAVLDAAVRAGEGAAGA